MQFRLPRSKAFWFGVPGLVFLSWGWWHSMGHSAGVGVAGRDYLQVGHIAGYVILTRIENVNLTRWEISQSSVAQSDQRVMDAKAHIELGTIPGPNTSRAYIPYRYLILAYLAIWGGVLGWRWRRYWKAGAEEVPS